MPLPCTVCLIRSPCKNQSNMRWTSWDYRMIHLLDKCPELKAYIFPDSHFNQDHYDELERFLKYGDDPSS